MKLSICASFLLLFLHSSSGFWGRRRRRRPVLPAPKPCASLNAPYNGWIGSSSKGHGATVSVHCNQGYTLHGNGNLKCTDGVWSPSLPTCVDVNECKSATHDCSSSAQCVNIDGGFQCKCDTGYDLYNNGKACTQRCPGGCVHGLCRMKKASNGPVLPEYKCDCLPKWSSTSCNQAICSQGCTNGQCFRPDDCSCNDGWTGASCNIAICSRGCKHGTCNSPETCLCQTGWEGETCDEPICSKKCTNGQCVRPNDCSCHAGWTGVSCNIAICSRKCKHGTCDRPEKCFCQTGWTGETCDEPICSKECTNGQCVRPNDCSCHDGWTGVSCNKAICSRGCKHGTCDSPEKCFCQTGWAGETCDEPICSKKCENGQCLRPNYCSCHAGWRGASCNLAICSRKCKHGTCDSPETCLCQTGWEGETCDEPICSIKCTNGQCVRPNYCSCHVGWTGASCNIAVCSRKCKHGRCDSPETCLCQTGWDGETCDEPICSKKCTNGQCVRPNDCSCHDGWTGASCNIAVCSRGCKHGTCDSPKTCSCQTGWTGETCDEPICSKKCTNGQCVRPNDCSCHDGWTGASCNIAVCSRGCKHGTCDSPKTCSCQTGWTGETCDEPICSKKCANGQCLRPNDCSCYDGWTGASCNIAICSRGCKHGKCDSPETCSCKTGWAGETCDEPICSKKCKNDGVCEAPDTCNCKETDWEGDTCSKPVCENVCENGGTCVAPSTCDCVDGYTGSQCEIKTCKDIDAPDNGLVSCLTFNKQQVCNIFCNDAYDFSRAPDNPFVCGVNGNWSHEKLKVPVPECVEADPLGIFITVESKFEYPGDCESLSPEERSKISSMTFQSLLERLCPCNEITITNSEEVECGAGAGRRRRQVGGKISSVAIVVKFRLEASKDSRRILNSKFCNSTCRAATGKLVGAVRAAAAKLVTSVEEDPLRVEINGVTLKSSDVTTGKIQASCNNPGQIRSGTRCITCSKGNHIRKGKCEPCPLHTYQDADGKTECILCPNRAQTLWKGSKSLEECLRPCQRGTYADNGLHPCTPCPMHSYQAEQGQTSCFTCPNGTITTAKGASHESMCVPNCTNDCIYGFRCDGCRCISRYKVCDLTQNCVDGSDEQHCDSCDGFRCPADFLVYQDICTSSFAAVAEIKEVVSMEDNTTMMKCDVKKILYSANSTNITSVNNGHFYLGSKAVACHCPSAQAGNQYMLTGHKNRDGALVVSHRGIFKPWRNDTQPEISEAISLVKNGNCSLTYGWDE